MTRGISRDKVEPVNNVKMRPLNKNERAFVDAFAATGFSNATEAYRRAYPTSRGWKDDQIVSSAAWKVQQRDHVLNSIKDLQRVRERAIAEMAQRYAISKESLAEVLASIAFSNIGDYAKWDEKGRITFTPSNLLTPRQLGAITEIRMTSAGTVVLKMASRMDAVMNIARLAGMLGAEVKEKDEDDPDVIRRRDEARQVMRDLLRKMAVPEPLTIDGTATKE